MIFGNPWGLLGLLTLPVIVGIHLYHRRFPQMYIAGAHLWGMETEIRAAGRKRERLPITATLLLELLAALLLTLVLSQPRFGTAGTTTHLVVALDNSASMQAEPGDGSSFRDRAIQILDDRIEELERDCRVTLIKSGQRPSMLAGPAVPWLEAKEMLAGWQPEDARHEFQPAWDLASQIAGNTGQQLFLTDRMPPEDFSAPREMEIVAVGRPLPNVAIAAARWTLNPVTLSGRLFVWIDNHSQNEASVVITAKAKDQTVFQKQVAIRGNSGVPVETDVAGGLKTITITLKSGLDGLAHDNRVTLIEPKLRRLKIALRLPAGSEAHRVTEKALRSFPDADLVSDAVADLIIEPAGSLPPSNEEMWWLGIGPIDPDEEKRKAALDVTGPFLLEKRHPLLEGVVLGGIVWGGVQEMPLQNISPLISAGDQTLLAQLNGTETTAFIMNIDMVRSNLNESPDWPILLSNLVELRRQSLPGMQRWNYRLNETIQFRRPEIADGKSERDLKLVFGDEIRPLVPTEIVEVTPPDQTGIYEIRDGEDLVDRFAVNFFDSQESDLKRLGEGERPAVFEEEPERYALDSPFTWLILAGIGLILLVVFADWFVLRPRRMQHRPTTTTT